MTKRKYRFALAAILLAAFLLRLALWLPAVTAGTPERFRRPDSGGYLTPGTVLAETGRFALAPGGAPTAIRAPGVAWCMAAVRQMGGGETALSLFFVFVSTATVGIVALAGKAWQDEKTGIGAALFAALSPTAAAQAPMLLSDTLFAFFAAVNFWLMILTWKRRQIRWFVAAAAVMAMGTLVRPIGLVWLLPGIVMLAALPGIPWKRKAAGAGVALLLQFIILFPWMARNAMTGSGWCIDTNTGAMAHQNGAMILAAAHGTSFEVEKRAILAGLEAEFADGKRFPDEAARSKRRKERFCEIVLSHPWIALRQHFRPWSMLPDLPTLCELCGVTRSDRGTMDVLQRRGLMAAVRHYFGGRGVLPYVLLFFPLLLAAFAVRAGAFCQWFSLWRAPWKNRVELLLFLGCGIYYLFLPGAITAPRYFLPALPVFAVYAAQFLNRFRKQ